MEWSRGECIGMGKFGNVFMAIPTSDSKLPAMAVKSAPEDKAASLLREHKILDKFRGVPGVIQCLGGGFSGDQSDGPRTYDLLLEYAPGGSLRDLMAKYPSGRIPESHVRVYTGMILQALSAIHSRGYTHCDIKPDNILVFPRSENRGEAEKQGICDLKIADFGLAMETRNPRPGKKYYGASLRYVPPEVLNSREITPGMDIWALGGTVIEMLTGEQPWSKWEQDAEVMRAICECSRPEIPQWVSRQGKDFLNCCFAGNSISRQRVGRFPFVDGNCYRVIDAGGNRGGKPAALPPVVRRDMFLIEA